MMHNSPILHWLHIAAMLVAGVAALLIGLMPFGFNILDQEFLRNPHLLMILQYILLAAGVVLLAVTGLKLAGVCGCHCAEKKNPPYA